MNKTKFVLVAEDDKFYASIYKRKLVAEGYNVEVAENGKEALEIAQKKIPDLILLDLIMPIMDGFSTLVELKKNAPLSKVKVVVMTNLGQEEDIKKAKDLGADEYLVKSNLSIKELTDKISSYLQ